MTETQAIQAGDKVRFGQFSSFKSNNIRGPFTVRRVIEGGKYISIDDKNGKSFANGEEGFWNASHFELIENDNSTP